MKPCALLVNMARGPVINRYDLEAHLQAGKLGGVGLDVHWLEPGWNPTEPVYQHDRVISLPHIGSTTTEVFEQFAKWIADNITRYRSGRALLGALWGDRAGNRYFVDENWWHWGNVSVLEVCFRTGAPWFWWPPLLQPGFQGWAHLSMGCCYGHVEGMCRPMAPYHLRDKQLEKKCWVLQVIRY